MAPAHTPTEMVTKSIRLPETLHDRYLAAQRVSDPEANLGRALRRHMREFLAEHDQETAA